MKALLCNKHAIHQCVGQLSSRNQRRSPLPVCSEHKTTVRILKSPRALGPAPLPIPIHPARALTTILALDKQKGENGSHSKQEINFVQSSPQPASTAMKDYPVLPPHLSSSSSPSSSHNTRAINHLCCLPMPGQLLLPSQPPSACDLSGIHPLLGSCYTGLP